MKNLFRMFSILVAFCMAFSLITPVGAQAPTPPTPQTVPEPDKDDPWRGTDASLLGLPAMQVEDFLQGAKYALPEGVTPRGAEKFVRGLVEENFWQVEPLLHSLQAEGRIADYKLLPELNAISILGARPDTLTELEMKSGLALKNESQSACMSKNIKTLSRNLVTLNDLMASGEDVEAATINKPPSVRIEGSWGYDAYSVTGKTGAKLQVRMDVVHEGGVAYTLYTTSDKKGYYGFWQDFFCDTGTPNFLILPGDEVHVTAFDRPTTMVTYFDLHATVDSVNNMIVGNTETAGRKVKITLYNATTDCGSGPKSVKTLYSTLGGDFTQVYGMKPDINGQAYAIVESLDTLGNGVYDYFYGTYLNFTIGGSYFTGQWYPNQTMNFNVMRGADTLASGSTTTYDDGYLYVSVGTALQAGDVISATPPAGAGMATTVADFSVTLDEKRNRAVGLTTPGMKVTGYFYSGSYNSCTSKNNCKTAKANPMTGAFILTAGMDLPRGGYAYFDLYDPAGNRQGISPTFYTPLIRADMNYNDFYVRWGSRPGSFTARLLDATGVELSSRTYVTTGNTLGWYSFYNASSEVIPLMPGYTIEITGGMSVEKLVVPNLGGGINPAIQRVTGTSGRGSIMIQYYDYRAEIDGYYYFCTKLGASTKFSARVKGAQMGQQDSAFLRNVDRSGHIMERTVNAFGVVVNYYYNYLKVAAFTPETPLTVVQKLGAVVLNTYSMSFSRDGVVYLYPDPALTAGQTVEVTTTTNTLTVPLEQLVIAEDAAHNNLTGFGPPNSTLLVTLYKLVGSGTTSIPRLTVTASDGSFVLNYDNYGFYWYDSNQGRYRCAMAVVGDCTYPGVRYTNPDGVYFVNRGPEPPAEADAYEPDNSFAEAKPYTDASYHTHHVAGDNDYISFVVEAEDVGQEYWFETYNLGGSEDTYMYLYDGAQNQLTYDDDDGPGLGSLIYYTFNTPGTYYIRIRPYNVSATPNCASFYTFAMGSY